MDGKKISATLGNIVVMDTSPSEETRGMALNIQNKGAGPQEKVVLGQVTSVSQFLLEDGRWMDTPYNVGDYVIYAFTAGAGTIWQHTEIQEGSSIGATYTYRILKWTEIIGKYNGEK